MARLVKATVSSNPFVGDPPGAGELYEAVGRYIRVWSFLEENLNSLLLMMIDHRFVIPVRDQLKLGEDGPVSLKRKLQLWRRLWTHTPEFSKFKMPAEAFAKLVGEASRDRATVLHSAWERISSAESFTVRARSLKMQAGSLIDESKTFNLGQVRQMMEIADALNTRLVAFTLYVAKTSRPAASEGTQKPEQP